MDMSVCALCGSDLDETPIIYQGMAFCSEDCRDDWRRDLDDDDDFEIGETGAEEDSLDDLLLDNDDLEVDLDDDVDDTLSTDLADDLY